MSSIQTDALSILKHWFERAENWQKDLFYQIWQGNDDVEKLTSRALSLAKSEYLSEKSKFAPTTTFPTEMKSSSSQSCPVILKSVSDVQGVGALSSTRPLEFGDNLTIVYGENGCGKSSYVRILKSAASPKSSETILSNVFEKNSPAPQASLSYSDDGELRIINWKPNMRCSCPLNIYDSSIAKRFAEEKNEVIYEPQILSLLSLMAKVYEAVKEKIEELVTNNSACQSSLDEGIANYELIVQFLELKTITAYNKFIASIIWTEKEQVELDVLKEGLHEQDPSKRLNALKAQKDLVEKQYRSIFDLIVKLGEGFSEKYLMQRKAQIETKAEADALIEKLQESAVLVKTGSEKWKKMWSTAVTFAQEINAENTGTAVDNGKCVLCQQEISDDSAKRLGVFSEYMTSQIVKKSDKAYMEFQSTVESLQSVCSSINTEQTEVILRSTGLADEIVDHIILQYKTILARGKWLLEYDEETKTPIPVLSEIKDLQKIMDKLASDYTARIESLKKIVANKNNQILRMHSLIALKWIYDNKDVRRKHILLKNALSGCKTNALTSLKKELTQVLITNTYITRFQSEMDKMDHKHRIRVELVSKAEKGRAYHQVSLKGAVEKKKTGDILSEGEFRVVSLAAFLADLSSWNKILPFIFDDPITSLDHKYERMVAQRLVSLSNERQVIVFTHRLAYAQLLVSCRDEFNKAQLESKLPIIDVKQIELRNSPLGEPTTPTYRGDVKLKNALNSLLINDIPFLKKCYDNGEYESYDKGIKSLCSDFRKIVEQGIETDLLSKIVTRFDYAVSSLRLKYLYIVEKSDIDIFNDMMTKYSAYEHSQSMERPIELPELSDIESDIKTLINWCTDFKKRYNAVDKK